MQVAGAGAGVGWIEVGKKKKDKMRISGPVYLLGDRMHSTSVRQGKRREAALRGNWQLMDNCDGGCKIVWNTKCQMIGCR